MLSTPTTTPINGRSNTLHRLPMHATFSTEDKKGGQTPEPLVRVVYGSSESRAGHLLFFLDRMEGSVSSRAIAEGGDGAPRQDHLGTTHERDTDGSCRPDSSLYVFAAVGSVGSGRWRPILGPTLRACCWYVRVGCGGGGLLSPPVMIIFLALSFQAFIYLHPPLLWLLCKRCGVNINPLRSAQAGNGRLRYPTNTPTEEMRSVM